MPSPAGSSSSESAAAAGAGAGRPWEAGSSAGPAAWPDPLGSDAGAEGGDEERRGLPQAAEACELSWLTLRVRLRF